MHREGVTEVVRSRANTPLFRLQPGLLEQTTEGFASRIDLQPILIGTNEKTRVRLWTRLLYTSSKVLTQFSR